LVLAALDRVVDPKSGRGLAAAGLVQGLVVGEGRAGFILEVGRADAALYAPVRDAAEAALMEVAGVERAQVVLTAAAGPPAPGSVRVSKGARVASDPRARPEAMPPPPPLAHVRRVIAVASGKGGVGKSTVAVNLACALAARGLRTGLLDADIYGPSAPRMLGLDEQPRFEDGKLEPLEAFGVKVMSIGFIVDEGAPMIWRGPMASSAVRQMIEDVRWGTESEQLDVLVVDLPPGTGDIHLTLVQKLAVDGVVIVSTPQEIALIDARRAVAMFAKMHPPVPILGVIENMAFFAGPGGERIPIFGEGGARREAGRLEVPFLGEVPLDIALRRGGDEGQPLVITAPDSPVAGVFKAMAARLVG
jgi:ATP-binding protein involved in chromosome partitioning